MGLGIVRAPPRSHADINKDRHMFAGIRVFFWACCFSKSGGQNRLRDVASHRSLAILPTRRCPSNAWANGAPDFELATDASARRLPTLLLRPRYPSHRPG